MSLSKVLNAAAHGHIHETVGGSWNHYFADEAGPESDEVLTFAHEIQASMSHVSARRAIKTTGVEDTYVTCSTPLLPAQVELRATLIR